MVESTWTDGFTLNNISCTEQHNYMYNVYTAVSEADYFNCLLHAVTHHIELPILVEKHREDESGDDTGGH